MELDGTPPLQDLGNEFDSLVEDSKSTLKHIESLPTQDIATTCDLRSDQVRNSTSKEWFRL